jgi:hypothetical protein
VSRHHRLLEVHNSRQFLASKRSISKYVCHALACNCRPFET